MKIGQKCPLDTIRYGFIYPENKDIKSEKIEKSINVTKLNKPNRKNK